MVCLRLELDAVRSIGPATLPPPRRGPSPRARLAARRALPRALLVLLAVLAAAPAFAQEIRFGVSGLHAVPEDAWAELAPGSRRALVESRAALATRVGATVVRTGDVSPQLLSRAAIELADCPKWMDADAFVGALTATGATVCVTLPGLLATGELTTSYRAFVRALAERYDGDMDFDVTGAALNCDFPDIDGSGQVTSMDWNAAPDALKAWASAHRVQVIEIGHRPSAAEAAGLIGADDYAAQLVAAASEISEAAPLVEVMLAGTLLDGQTKKQFAARLASLPLDPTTFDAANVQVVELVSELSQGQAGKAIAQFPLWLEAVAHGGATRWLGEMSFPSAAGVGPCADPRCSERLQAASLVRLVLLAIESGTASLLYSRLLEAAGDGEDDDPHASTGLLRVELLTGVEPSTLPLVPRPAYATWRRLQALLAGRDLADVVPLVGLPQNAHGYRVADEGWILWYDWMLEALPDAPYAGAIKQVVLEGVAAPWVTVSPLWPASLADELRADGTVEASWDEELVASADGQATVRIGQDPLWVAPTVEGPPEPEPEPVADVQSGDASTAEVVDAAAPDKKKGCQGGQGGRPLAALIVLSLLALLAWAGPRRRRV